MDRSIDEFFQKMEIWTPSLPINRLDTEICREFVIHAETLYEDFKTKWLYLSRTSRSIKI